MVKIADETADHGYSVLTRHSMFDPEAEVPYEESFHSAVAAAWADGAHTPRHRVLYLEREENVAALTGAGLDAAQVVWSEHHMALYRARAKARSS